MVHGQALAAPLRAAVIGLGNIAWKYDAGIVGSVLTHCSTYAADTRTTVVVGYDRDPAQGAAFAHGTGVPIATSLEDLLARRPDIVSICSPNHLHAEHLRACLNACIPMIWLEKPATTDADEARRLLDLQRSLRASTVLVGFQRRYQAAYQRLRALTESGELGPCKGISITYSRGLETNGVHLIDLLFDLLGEDAPYELCGVTPADGPAASPSFLLRFANGVDCVVTGLDLDYHSIDITVHFAAGRAAVLYGGVVEIRERRIENPFYPGFFRLDTDSSHAAPQADLEQDANAAFPRMLTDLIEAHAAGRSPRSTLATAVTAQALVDRILHQADGP